MFRSKASSIRSYGSLLIFFAAAVLLLFFSGAVRQGVSEGLSLSAAVLIPSLFPFLIFAGILSNSRASLVLEKLFAPVTVRFFRLPKCAASAVVMGFLGGYPVGAKMTAMLLSQGKIDEDTAGRMLCFLVNAGPSFLITAVGSGLLDNLPAGVLLLAAQWFSALAIGFILGRIPRPIHRGEEGFSGGALTFSAALVQGVQSAISGMLSIVGFVLLFSAVNRLLFTFLGENAFTFLLSGLLEVTTGCVQAARNGKSLLYIGFLTSFSGCCVFCQAISFFPKKAPRLGWFLLSRPVHGVLTALLIKAGVMLFPQSDPVFSTVSQPVSPQLSATPAVAVLLAVLCGAFLLSLPAGNFRRLD